MYHSSLQYIWGQTAHPDHAGQEERMDEKFLGLMYVVYEEDVVHTSTDEAEILYVTAYPWHARVYAQTYQGVVYSYDVTQEEEFINEIFVYDGTRG